MQWGESNDGVCLRSGTATPARRSGDQAHKVKKRIHTAIFDILPFKAFTQQQVLSALKAKASTGHRVRHPGKGNARTSQPQEAIPVAVMRELNAAFERGGEDEDMEAEFDVRAVSCRIGDKVPPLRAQLPLA